MARHESEPDHADPKRPNSAEPAPLQGGVAAPQRSTSSVSRRGQSHDPWHLTSEGTWMRPKRKKSNFLHQIFYPHDLHILSTVDVEKSEQTARELRDAGLGHDEIEHALSQEAGCRQRFVGFIHHPKVQTLLLLLLVLDVCLVIAEIIILSHKRPVLEVVEREWEVDGVMRFCGAENLTFAGNDLFQLDSGCTLLVKNELSKGLEVTEKVLGWISFGILVVFAVELLALLICLGRHFFTAMYVLDTIIIATSIVLHFALTEESETASSVIIFVRCWRFARILHGVGLSVHDHDEEELKKAEEETTEVKHKFEDKCAEVETLKVEIQRLSPAGSKPTTTAPF